MQDIEQLIKKIEYFIECYKEDLKHLVNNEEDNKYKKGLVQGKIEKIHVAVERLGVLKKVAKGVYNGRSK